MRWSLSYRVRAIVLVALLTGAAVAATAWISARSTVAQLADSVGSQQADIDLIAQQLQRYGIVHGAWNGVPELILRLEGETSQRIKLTTQDGEVIVDTDNLHGWAARPTTDRAPVAIVPRPTLDLTGLDRKRAYDATLAAMPDYRAGAQVAACLSRHGVEVTSTTQRYGIPQLTYDPRAAAAAGCRPAPPTAAELRADRFWRADPARARDTGGSGLGLPITREIVHAHGGRLEVASTPGAGTTVTISLPAATATD